MIQIIIDYQKIEDVKKYLLKQLILRRAYVGYTWYVIDGGQEPLTFNEFKKFEFWKIEMSFRIYFNKFKKGKFGNSYLNFTSVILNKITI
jgi:hypothetical protein